jgi:hypothetical protein
MRWKDMQHAAVEISIQLFVENRRGKITWKIYRWTNVVILEKNIG